MALTLLSSYQRFYWGEIEMQKRRKAVRGNRAGYRMGVMRLRVCGASLVFLGAIGLAAVPASAQQAKSPAVFSSEEDSVPGAVALPECARKWLARDAHV